MDLTLTMYKYVELLLFGLQVRLDPPGRLLMTMALNHLDPPGYLLFLMETKPNKTFWYPSPSEPRLSDLFWTYWY